MMLLVVVVSPGQNPKAYATAGGVDYIGVHIMLEGKVWVVVHVCISRVVISARWVKQVDVTT